MVAAEAAANWRFEGLALGAAVVAVSFLAELAGFAGIAGLLPTSTSDYWRWWNDGEQLGLGGFEALSTDTVTSAGNSSDAVEFVHDELHKSADVLDTEGIHKVVDSTVNPVEHTSVCHDHETEARSPRRENSIAECCRWGDRASAWSLLLP